MQVDYREEEKGEEDQLMQVDHREEQKEEAVQLMQDDQEAKQIIYSDENIVGEVCATIVKDLKQADTIRYHCLLCKNQSIKHRDKHTARVHRGIMP